MISGWGDDIFEIAFDNEERAVILLGGECHSDDYFSQE